MIDKPGKPPQFPSPTPGGNAATPQKHEHSQVPEPPLPLPLTIEPGGLWLLFVGGGGTITGSSVEAGGADVTGGTDEAGEVTTTDDEYGGADAGGASPAVPFCAIAICLKVACDLSGVGLMLNVMPMPQWPFCLQ